MTFVQRFGGLVNLNVHFHLVVPDGVFVEDGEGLRFEMLPVPTNANVLAILDRVMRRIASRLAKDVTIGDVDENAVPDVLAQVQAEASPSSPFSGSYVSSRYARTGASSPGAGIASSTDSDRHARRPPGGVPM